MNRITKYRFDKKTKNEIILLLIHVHEYRLCLWLTNEKQTMARYDVNNKTRYVCDHHLP